MPSAVQLSEMVDLALGTPEVGSVNFNVLHTLLHAVISKLGISEAKAELTEEDEETLKTPRPDQSDLASRGGSAYTKDSGLEETDVEQESPAASRDQTRNEILPKKKSHYHALESKVSKIEQQLDELNRLPSNTELFDRSKETPNTRAVSDMWQTMQITKRVDANEAGVGKLMSMVQDLLNEMQKLRNDNDSIKKLIDELNVSDLKDKLKKLEDLTNELNDKFTQLPGPDFYEGFVTWKGLEDALKGVREDLKPPERVVIEMSMQTDPKSSSTSNTTSSSSSSAVHVARSYENVRPPSSKPSRELQAMLEKLGVLSVKHDSLEVRVDNVEEELKKKADKEDLEGLSVPDDLLAQLKQIQEDVDSLLKSRDRDSANRQKDTEALNRAHRAIAQLQSEIDKLLNTTQFLMDENNNKTKQIEELVDVTKQLDEKKADKDYVDNGLEEKADKKMLDAKLNSSVFENTVAEINKAINDILNRLDGHDEEWKQAIAELSKEIDNKIDRLELDALKDYLESRLKALNNKIKGMNMTDMNDDDAAGIRKQMAQRYHCISCDRPVDMFPHGPIPALPGQSGLPGNRSSRPYTTFELEQIRQQAKLQNSPKSTLDKRTTSPAMGFGAPDIAEQLYSTARPCGGSHTMTYPHKRVTRLTHLSNLFREDEPPVPVQAFKEELDIQGADGHIYKGRVDRLPAVNQNQEMNETKRFPPLPSAQSNRPLSPQMINRAKTTASPASARRAGGSPDQRPLSGRSVSRPHSAHPTSISRPLSARNSNANNRETQNSPTLIVPGADAMRSTSPVNGE
ncbi:uncharacterized protein LOC141903415 isoform X2 [Tubulanus polymorphus]|uniref:uncharacterized protein LOC141903415 isoform X2 n=1 Tax=Tubulanus polymorphus TaxID=672921 RepID=UPI003DA5EBD1